VCIKFLIVAVTDLASFQVQLDKEDDEFESILRSVKSKPGFAKATAAPLLAKIEGQGIADNKSIKLKKRAIEPPRFGGFPQAKASLQRMNEFEKSLTTKMEEEPMEETPPADFLDILANALDSDVRIIVVLIFFFFLRKDPN